MPERQPCNENITDGGTGIFLSNVTASWAKNGANSITGACLVSKNGQLLGITGPVGSGKVCPLLSCLDHANDK